MQVGQQVETTIGFAFGGFDTVSVGVTPGAAAPTGVGAALIAILALGVTLPRHVFPSALLVWPG